MYSPWPNALLFGVQMRDGGTVTVEVGGKREAEELIGHLRAVVGMGEGYGGKVRGEGHGGRRRRELSGGVI